MSDERAETHGLATTKANKKPVLSQLMEDSVTLKKCAAVEETAEKANHYF
jgi:hypothetical protein